MWLSSESSGPGPRAAGLANHVLTRRTRLAWLLLLGVLAACGQDAPGASRAPAAAPAATPAKAPAAAPAAAPPAAPVRVTDASRPRNVVLISIDTLRADHVGVYGYGRPTSPRIDAFASRAVVFSDSHSVSGHTLSSHKSLLSGRLPSSLLAAFSRSGGPARATSSALGYYQAALLGWPTPSLARRLKEEGLYTLGLTDAGYLQAQFGFAEGFDEYRSVRVGIGRHCSKAEEWIQANTGRPFFLFLHGYDVHCPYNPPEPFLRKFEPACTGRLQFDGACGKDYFNKLLLTAEEKEHIRRHYDAGILHADDEVGKFLDFLERQGHFADTVIVITSDHGESLGEREFVGHGELYENQLRVPLIVYAPGFAPGFVAAPVSGIDVTPTILDLLLGKVPEGLDGWSLRGLLATAAGSAAGAGSKPAGSAGSQASVGTHTISDFEARPRIAAITVNEGRGYFTRLRKLAVQDRSMKMIVDLEARDTQLFDLSRDPSEAKNLAGSGRPEQERLLRVARERDPGVLKGFDLTGQARGDEPLTPEMREELKALGYVN